MHRFRLNESRPLRFAVSFFLFVGLLSLLDLLPAAAQTAYLIEDLGRLDNRPDYSIGIWPMGINNSGQVSGYAPTSADGRFHNFFWSNGMIQDLGVVAGDIVPVNVNFSSRRFNVTGGINDAGQVAGNFISTPSNTFHAFLYDPIMGLKDFGPGEEGQFPNITSIPNIGYGFGQGTHACGINNFGEVVGWQADNPPVGLFYDGTSVRNLDFIINQLPTVRTVCATAINDNHQLVGQYIHFSMPNDFLIPDYYHAYRYKVGGGFEDLGTLHPVSGSTSFATAINLSGTVVGVSDDRPFLTTGMGMQDLGTLFRFGAFDGIGFARSINARGDIVGYSLPTLASSASAAVLWRAPGHTVQDLNTLIDPNAGWLLSDATGINDKGQIVGYGNRVGFNGPRGFRLTPIAASDVTAQTQVTRGGFRYNRATNRYTQTVTITNLAGYKLFGSLSLALDNLPGGISLANPTGTTQLLTPAGSPYRTVSAGDLAPGASATITLEFNNPSNAAITYAARVQSGAGQR